MTKSLQLVPSCEAVCVRLANRCHASGLLLWRIVYWQRFAKITIPGKDGTWIANPRSWWMDDAQLTERQCDRSIAALTKLGLINRTQFWFGRRNILHVQLSAKTYELLKLLVDKSWPEIEALLNTPEHATSGKPSLPKVASLEVAKSGKPSLPKSANP